MKYRIPINQPPLYGSYGPDGTNRQVQPGEVFDVPDYMVKKLEILESKGLIERYIDRPRVDRKAYTVYANKALRPAENK